MTDPIRFNDGASYERYMGVWSQLAGAAFLDWLAPASAWRWLETRVRGVGGGPDRGKLAGLVNDTKAASKSVIQVVTVP